MIKTIKCRSSQCRSNALERGVDGAREYWWGERGDSTLSYQGIERQATLRLRKFARTFNSPPLRTKDGWKVCVCSFQATTRNCDLSHVLSHLIDDVGKGPEPEERAGGGGEQARVFHRHFHELGGGLCPLQLPRIHPFLKEEEVP